MKPGRLHALDAIRGLLAIGVMVYHVVPGTPEAFGTWGVYAFFALSGYALDHVYRGRLDVRDFAVARIARLAPLWIPVVLVSAGLADIHDPARILLNLTGLFGFVMPGATSIVTGGWSIGIEVVFYALFPLLVACSTRTIAIATLAALVLRFVHVGGLMPEDLVAEWVQYTVAQSFLVFFLTGMLGSRLRLVTREWTGRPAGVATALGDLSYGTYLLHPIFMYTVGPELALLTPVIALAIHRWYEVPTGRWVKHRLKRHRQAERRGEVVAA